MAAAAFAFVANSAIDALKVASDRAKNDLTAQYVAYGTQQLGDATASQCIIIARGRRGPRRPDVEASSRALNARILDQIGAATYPSLYVEILVKREA